MKKNILQIFGLIICLSFSVISLKAEEKMSLQDHSVDYNQLRIKSYKHWDVYLHENQCYLGRVFVQPKVNEKMEDFLEIDGEVRNEFFQVGKEVKKALEILFKPDKMNYAALSNTSPVVHIHIIPRYADVREFANVEFKDTRWGSNYAPYDRSFTIDEVTLFKIRDAIKEKLS